MSYNKFPSNATLKPTTFVTHIPDLQLSNFKTLLRLSPIGPETYENTTRTDGQYGIGRKWLIETKDHWLDKYDWRKTEDHINSFPASPFPSKPKTAKPTRSTSPLYSPRSPTPSPSAYSTAGPAASSSSYTSSTSSKVNTRPKTSHTTTSSPPYPATPSPTAHPSVKNGPTKT